MSIGISGGLGGGGGRMGYLHTGNLFLDFLRGFLPTKDGMVGGGGSGLQGNIGGGEGLGCGCAIGCNF